MMNCVQSYLPCDAVPIVCSGKIREERRDLAMPPTRSLSRGNSASTRPWIAGSLADTECVAQCLRDGDAVTRCRENIKNVMTQLEIKRPTMRTERAKMQADLCDG